MTITRHSVLFKKYRGEALGYVVFAPTRRGVIARLLAIIEAEMLMV